MKRIAAVLALVVMLPMPAVLAAGTTTTTTDPKTFRWATKCSEIPTPRIAVCRIIPDVEQGVIYRGPSIPLIFQIDNLKGRSIAIGSDRNCLEQPALLRFGANPPFIIRTNDSLNDAVFDRVVAEFRAAQSGTIEYAVLPDCRRITATFYYNNLDDALAKAQAVVGADR
jgi:hypothetical protein